MNENKLKVYNNYVKSHSFPVTRRQFLSSGLVSFSALALPAFSSVNPLLPKENFEGYPYMSLDLAGGPGLVGNFLVGGKGGPLDLLKSYKSLGWNPRETILDSRFGLPMAGNDVSKILVGLKASMSEEAQKNFRFASILHQSQDDTNSNIQITASHIHSMGYKGDYLATPIGSSATLSGGNSNPVNQSNSVKPLFISNFQSLVDTATLGPAFRNILSGDLTKVVMGLSEMAGDRLSELREKNKISQNQLEFVKNKYSEKANLILGKGLVDPRENTQVSQIYNITRDTSITSEDLKNAAFVYSMLNRYSGPLVYTIGGCDYHDGGSATGDAKDLEIGTFIGRAVEAAHRMEKPIFLHITTDGGMYTSPGTRNWVSDSPLRTMSLIGVYHPKQTPTYTKNGPQLGYFTDGEGVFTDTFFGSSPKIASYIVMANYFNLIGELGKHEDEFLKIMSRTQLEESLLFETIGS